MGREQLRKVSLVQKAPDTLVGSDVSSYTSSILDKRISRREILKGAATLVTGSLLSATGCGTSERQVSAQPMKPTHDTYTPTNFSYPTPTEVFQSATPTTVDSASASIVPTSTDNPPTATPEITVTPTPPPSSTEIPNATSTPEPTSTPEKQPDATTLKEAANRIGFTMGVLADTGGKGTEPFSILRTQFNELIISAGAQFSRVKPTRDGPYNFSLSDAYVRIARQNVQDVMGMHLIWGFEGLPGLPAEVPDWVKRISSSSEATNVMKDYIQTTLNHHKGKIKEWTVNEGTENNVWKRLIGPQYLETVLKTARESDPDVKLIYNDFGIEYDGAPKSDMVFNLINELKQRNLIDAVGMQMHFTGGRNLDPLNPPTKEQIIAAMKRYQAIGVDVYITELDVIESTFPGSQDDKERQQGEIFALPVQAAIESGACKKIIIWGVNDSSSWKKDDTPLLFTNNQPKPAFFKLLDTLNKAKTPKT